MNEAQLSATHLSDPLHCQRVRAALDDMGVQWQVRVASPTLHHYLPRSPGLYMFVWEPYFRTKLAAGQEAMFPQVLYVGRAGGRQSNNTLQNRYANYVRFLSRQPNSELQGRQQRLTNLFQRKVLRYWFAPVRDRSKLEGMEDALIELFNPPGNSKRQRPKMRKKATIPAF